MKPKATAVATTTRTTTSKTGMMRDVNRKECNKDKDKSHGKKKDINSKLNNSFSHGEKPNNSTRVGAGAGSDPQIQSPRVALRNNLSKSRSAGGTSHHHHHHHSHHHSPSKRLSVTEQKQLAELVQRNMERNQQTRSQKIRSVRAI